MRKRHHLWAVAGLLVGRYGLGAPAQADEAYARQAECDGGDDAHAIWNDVTGSLHGRRVAARHFPRGQAD